MNIYARTQRSLCVVACITMLSYAVNSTRFLNYSKMLSLNYTTINKFEK